MAYQIILEDLRNCIPERPTVPTFFRLNEDWISQLKSLKKQYRRAKSLGNRKELLYTLWYMGELIDTQTEQCDQARCIVELTRYYYELAKKVFYLFEFIGIEQIGRTITMKVSHVARLTKPQLNSLIEESVVIAGARLSEEEVVTDDPLAI